MKRLATVLLLGLALHAHAASVPVGCGSYSNSVPAGYGGPLAQPAMPMVTGAFTQQPASHKWWQTFIWKNQGVTGQQIGEQMTAKPWAFKPYATGLGMAYVTTSQIWSGHVDYPYVDELYVGITGLNSPATRVDSYSDWAVTAQWNDGPNIMNATLGNGFPYAYFTKVAGASARVSFTAAVTVVSNLSGVLIATTNGHSYGIYGPSGSNWVQAGSVFTNTLVGTLGSNYFSVAILPDTSAATQALFLSSAYAFVTNTTVSWAYNQATAALTSTFTLQTVSKEQGQTLAMQALFRHQWKYYSGATTGLSYWGPRLGPKGEMKLVRSNNFSYSLPFNGLLPALPNNGSFDQTTLYDYVDCSYSNVLAPDTNSFCGNILSTVQDTYDEGHMLGKATDLIWLADQVGHTAARAAFLNSVETRLNNWFDAAGGTAPLYYYDSAWHCLIGYPSGFGSGEYINDHHFHSAYWIRAMAAVAHFDPAWWSGCHNGMAMMLVNNVANANRASTQFPFLRCFSPFEGHSWASGADGNNEESSSEDMQLCSALIQLGSAIGDTAMRDLGIFMYVNTAQAVEQYWFDVDDQIFPAAYAKLAAGQVWKNGYVYGTYFSGDPSAVVGIQLIPEYAGAAAYLGRFRPRLQAAIAQMGEATLATMFPEIFIMAESLYNPAQAVTDFSDYTLSGGSEGGGESLAFDYHWTQFFYCAGLLDTSVTADWPNTNVFVKGGQKTYCAYNPGATARTVNFSDGFSMNVAAKSLVAAGATCGPLPSATPTGLATASATRTRSPTLTATRSATPTLTRSATPPLVPTFTSTPSASATPTMTASRSPTQTGTKSATASATRSPTLTPSPSPTYSATPSRSGTPSVTMTVMGSFTFSPTLSPTRTVTPSSSPTPTYTATPSRSGTPSVTLTVMGSFTFSPTLTPTRTVTPSSSPTPTYTATPSRSGTPSVTLTVMGSYTFTPTMTVTRTTTPTSSPSPTLSPSPTRSLTPVMVPSATQSVPPTQTPAATASATSPGPGTTEGLPKPIQVCAVPNPQGGGQWRVAVQLAADAESLQLDLYTKSMVNIAVLELPGSWRAGWNHVQAEAEPGLSSGLYYVVVTGKNRVGKAVGPVAKIFYLR